jgi:hypothetical protein
MTARWRKSSRSGYAGENCVEIALSIDRDVKVRRTRHDRNYERPDERPPAPACART